MIVSENLNFRDAEVNSGFCLDLLAFLAGSEISTRCRCGFHVLQVVGLARCIFLGMHAYQKLMHVEREAQRTSGFPGGSDAP